MAEGAQHFLDHFKDPAAVARYADGPRRFVPGFDALHRMTGILLAERVPDDAHILGAGGGLELRALADAFPGWTFTGVDPAPAMLGLAAQTLGAHAHRAALVEGYIDDAPEGPFDGAVCLLTLHFLAAGERIRTAAEIRRRLKPGAPFVAAHGSFPQGEGERDRWLDRYASYAIASGADPEQTAGARTAVAQHVAMLSPDADEAVLRDAGFTGVEQFYAAFTWRGWVGYA
ncbi:class I SAM-dependent methyltransferase [Sphingopyxis sp. KK2]|uniref:class I SAM-dependent methyltransferase n=1 Tax=Sphingopyxis sp. KK2 TaxID=1855727 RepID=UPI00097E6673|nr:class I SAM-dependent methyltransferase [Sphingopyxis sp. KK2]